MINSKLKSRPTISSAVLTDGMSDAELFQNAVVRPIIKMQHDLLMAYFVNYISTKNVKYPKLNSEARVHFIENSFQKDTQLRQELKGMILGHFTVSEYERYCKSSSEINKRMITMLKERVIDNRDELF